MKNFKVRCINARTDCFNVGDIYFVVDGFLIGKNGGKENSIILNSIDDVNECFISQFELVEEQFTKSYFKDGMVVTYRNGNTRLVFGNRFYDTTYIKTSGNTFDDYNDDLTMNGTSSEDIVKVEYMGEVLWEREKEYFTLEEAFKPNRLVKHKDCNEWCDNVHSALYEACENTKRDMFELLKVKEFEFKEV